MAIVTRSMDTMRARSLMTELGVSRFNVRSREASPEELVEAIRRAVED